MLPISFEYYASEYLGEPIPAAEFPRALARAQRAIILATHGRAGYPTLPAFLQDAIRQATCAQIEYYALYGVDVSIAGRTSDGWTVGKVHVNGGGSGKACTGAPSMLCPAALAHLEQTGLLNPQVPTLGDPSQLPWWYQGGM